MRASELSLTINYTPLPPTAANATNTTTNHHTTVAAPPPVGAGVGDVAALALPAAEVQARHTTTVTVLNSDLGLGPPTNTKPPPLLDSAATPPLLATTLSAAGPSAGPTATQSKFQYEFCGRPPW